MKQRPGDAQLSLDELRDMVGRQGATFSSRVLHYASSLRGTKQYWYILATFSSPCNGGHPQITYNFFKVSSKQIINESTEVQTLGVIRIQL